MNWYFDNAEAIARLKTELDSWIGTPFRHGCGVKQCGTDCIHFVWRSIQSAIPDHPPVVIPEYSKQWHLHRSEELLLNGVRDQFRGEELEQLEPGRDGDLYLFQFGRTTSHAGILLSGKIYHAISGASVQAAAWPDPMLQPRLTAAFRAVK